MVRNCICWSPSQRWPFDTEPPLLNILLSCFFTLAARLFLDRPWYNVPLSVSFGSKVPMIGEGERLYFRGKAPKSTGSGGRGGADAVDDMKNAWLSFKEREERAPLVIWKSGLRLSVSSAAQLCWVLQLGRSEEEFDQRLPYMEEWTISVDGLGVDVGDEVKDRMSGWRKR